MGSFWVAILKIPQAEIAVSGASDRVNLREKLELRRQEREVERLVIIWIFCLDVKGWHAVVVATPALAPFQGQIRIVVDISVYALNWRVANVIKELLVHVRKNTLWQVDALRQRCQRHCVAEVRVEDLAFVDPRSAKL